LREDICIFLGLKTDSKTALEFPSIGNHCHKARPVAPVNTKHQEKYCLTAQHVECPIYKRASVQRMPTRVTADRGFVRRNRFLLAVILMTVIFAGVAIVAVAMREDPGLATPPETMAQALSSNPASSTPTPTPSPTPSIIPTSTHNVTATGAFRPYLPTVDLTRQACPKPDGWTNYLFKTGDTMLKLSQYYGIPLDVLLAANCITRTTTIAVGEQMYVPMATSTPTPTVTMTPTITKTRRPYIPPTATPSSGGGKPPPTAPPP